MLKRRKEAFEVKETFENFFEKGRGVGRSTISEVRLEGGLWNSDIG